MDIYSIRLCCCIICKKQYHTKSFHTHFQRIHEKTQKNYKQHTEKATLGLINKAKERRDIYSKNPKLCKNCNEPQPYKKRMYNHCSQSCAATYNNYQRNYAEFKPGPPKGSKPKNYIPFTKIDQCVICNKYHKAGPKTCSPECKRKLLSIRVNERIDAGWNPQENRCRSTPSYLERSFEGWLLNQNYTNFVKNKTLRCNDKLYFGDFYFPTENLLIELDGKQHKKSVEYDKQRDENILLYHNIKTIRISYDEYIEKSKVAIIKKLLNIKEQVTGLEPAEPMRL